MPPISKLPWVPFLLAAYLGTSGVRKGSLSLSGGIAAFVVGFSMMSVPLKAFGVSLIVFYLVGSKATKAGKERKAALEEGHQAAGNRNAVQVLCNSFSAFLAALLWTALFDPESTVSSLLSSVLHPKESYDFQRCPLSPAIAGGSSRALLFVCLGHFACCLGDTLASEIGILAPSPPRLITTFKPVPPGTNGGVSMTGTIASLAGGVIMGSTLASSLLIENAGCRSDWINTIFPLVAWGAVAGVIGSLIDSLMGATIQRTKYSNTTRRILTDEGPAPPPSTDIKVISGIDILSNNQVNLMSSIITAMVLGLVA